MGSADAAVISAIFPRSGSLLGGQLITLSGSGFDRMETGGSTAVYIGNNLCPQLEVSNQDTRGTFSFFE
jgi:hypothetical protein